MFQKILFHVFMLGIFSFGLSHADWREDENGRNIAQKYLESNKNDDFWKDNSPRLGEGTPLYMEKETPSYVEYKVICEKNPSCGFIIVNIDGDDVDIPIASPSDIPPSKILTDKSGDKKENLQFFYFGFFDIYSKNTITEQINAIDPQLDPTEENDVIKDIKEEDKIQLQEFIKQQQKKIPQIFSQKLQDWKEYKQTEKFYEYKKQITESNDGYTIQSPGTEIVQGMKYVKGQSTSHCNSRVPCYKQYTYWYNLSYCASGCSPVAAAIIFGYHDRVGNYPNLLEGKIAPMTNAEYYPFESNPTPKSMIDEIRGYMGTECENGQGGTYRNRVQDGIKYAQNNGYPASYPQYINTYGAPPVSGIFTDEINAGRPLILQLTGHDVVLYGYALNNNYIITLNAGWGNGVYSNIHANLFSISLQGVYYEIAGFTKYIIQ